ncbi:MAG: GspH/FimT family pseudopilin [Stenotrophobium sp.]
MLKQPSLGFSLIELLTVLAVAAIGLALAVPSFNQTILSNRLTVTTNELVGAISQARLEAVKRNTSTQFCSNSSTNNGTDPLGLDCATSLGAVWSLDASGTTATQVLSPTQIPATISIGDGTSGTTAVAALRYAGDGLAGTATGIGPYTGLVADIFTSSLSSNNHRCIYLTTGSVISTCTVSGAIGACNVNVPNTCQQ